MRIVDLPLPDNYIDALVKAGYSDFYPPQAEAMPAVLAGKSVVLAAPTASGKSLVAYVACMQHVLKGGKAFYIVPLRALASEKQADLRGFEGLGIKVAYAAGDFDGPDPTLERYDIIVATSEKADSLMRHKSHWLNEITLVVADEVHLITDPDRGPTLEVTLAKFRKMNAGAQIIALSATIKNSKELADWLGAEHVYSEWRPVPLKEGVYLDGTISFSDFTSREVVGGARDPVERMVLDVVAEGGQALVFVNTRRSSESLAGKISGALLKVLGEGEKDALSALAKELAECQDEPTSFGDRLVICARGGAAFHNAGLTNAQRTRVEKAFKERVLKCIIATPTLAAGINLPARRVIVRDVHRYDANFGNVPIPIMEIKQMCGRAGRPRFDKYGEAVLIAKSDSERERLMERYLLSDAEPVVSKLGAEPALRTHILAAIATGQVADRRSLDDFISGTFFSHQQDKWKIDADIENVLEFLCQEGLVQDRQGLRPTQFGKRTSDLYIDPLSAVTLKKAVEEYGKLEGVSNLALLHSVCATPDIQALYLRTGDDWVEEAVDANKGPFLIGRANDFFLAEVKTAALIHDWMDERSENHIVNRFGIGPGDIRSKVESAEWIAYSFAELARLFGNAELTERLRVLVLRIQNGVKEELAPLVRLRGIGRIRARLLFQAGYKSATDIAQADEKKLSALPGIGPRIAASIKGQAGRI
ncbi:MAG: DEAD/DEAH box helicase [Euryarchaeota archaeon]|nr:DEAD/DEAH box helicase [Euryarchaeota archaeon]